MQVMSQAMRLQEVYPGKAPLPMIGSSHALHTLKNSLAKVSASNCTVLITGETGTGKELAAEFIHRNSHRRARPFICINCAAIPDSLLESELFGHSRGAFTGANENYEGLLTSANGGTVFLDEIGDMSLFAQAKILRVLEKKEVCRVGATRPVQLDIRFIAATNQSLETMAARGTFRKDLYFRLNVAQIHVPSLRERRDDVPVLLEHYAREFNTMSDFPDTLHKSLKFSEECMRFLLSYDWPGNIRELKNLVECLSIADLPAPIEREQLPHHFASPVVHADLARSRAGASDNPERESLISALFWAKGNKSAAAKRLRWSRMTLYRKIAKHKIFSGTRNGLEQLDSAELKV
jgi:transcriptional regulator with PAS, ATPase and Fis domain